MAKTNIIHKPNELIHMLPTSELRVSGSMRLLYNGVILISQKQGRQEEYVAVLNDILALCNLQSDFRTVKKIFKEIRRLDFEWRYTDENIDETRILGLIDEPRFVSRRGQETIVTWKLNPVIQDRLLDPSAFFTRLNLEMMTKLTKSGATIALYEICARYLTNNKAGGGVGRTGKHPVGWWIPRLVGSFDYKPEYKFFKRDFIKPALEEINQLTDIQVELHEFKVGKTVREIEFTITKKVQEQEVEIKETDPHQTDNQSENVSPISQRLAQYGINTKTASTIISQYDNAAYIERHLDGLSVAYRRGGVKSPAAWLQKSLTENWSHPTVADELPSAKQSASARLPITTAKQMDMSTKSNQSDISADQRSAAYERFLALSEEGKLFQINHFLQETNNFIKQEYANKKLKSAVFRRSFEAWLLSQTSEKLIDVT